MKKIYKQRPGAVLIRNDKEAQIIGSFLDREFPDGQITPRAVVEKARNPKSPVHKYFEWDDKKAAEKLRLVQARTLIKSIVVEIEGGVESEAFHHVFVKENKQSEYVRTEDCLNTQELWKQVLHNALQEAKRWSERYRAYNQLGPIHNSITEVERTLNYGKDSRTKGSIKKEARS